MLFSLKRKSAIARVDLYPGTGTINVNGKLFDVYMQNNPKLKIAPLDLLNFEKNYNIIVRTNGGGLNGQAEAIQLAISKALYNLVDIENQKKLRAAKFLTRNSLCKERRSLNYLLFIIFLVV
uniref:ribosomal protein S9 n=1 Tax=Colacium mucronatum TaxID=167756 RepID=UPI0023AAA542|nr:ribosomal protein S9 [Colacium mucronatum]WCH63262.1 ribosomal protein S9 [Colacium mucronatum]